MKVYIFIETDSEDSTYAYTEVYAKKEDAVKRLKTTYHEEAVERVESELIRRAWISDNHEQAWIEDEAEQLAHDWYIADGWGVYDSKEVTD